MKASKDQIERALDAPFGDIRLFLLYGPDEAGSRVLAKRVERAAGPDAERIDLDSAVLKTDPARLSDEAASSSLFGGKRHIRLIVSGDEALLSITGLLSAAAAGNPVVVIAGPLKPTSALLKLALADKRTLAFISYPPEAADADRIVTGLGRAAGLRITPEAVRRIIAIAGNDQAVMASEVEKLSLYLDAAPDRPQDADIDSLGRISAGNGDGELSKLVDAVFDGDAAAVSFEMTTLADDGTEGIALIRALNKRLHLLIRMRADVEAGRSPQTVVEAAGKSIFWKEKAAVTRQLTRWSAPRIAIVANRLLDAERAIKAPQSPGPILAAAELIAIGRAGSARRR